MKSLIFIGGFYHLAFFGFHLFFWKLFRWKEDLRSLSFINRNVMQILNLRLMWIFLVFAYVSFFHADELLKTALGKAFLISMALFWLMRAIEQFVFFGIFGAGKTASAAFFIVFLCGAAIYVCPVLF